MGKKVEEKQSLGDTAAAFGKFVYNGEDGTVMGRGAASWGKLGVFYLFYYAFLAGLFALSINLCLSFLDEEKPYFQTRLQTPGVSIQPKLPSKVEQSTDIIYSMTKKDESPDQLVGQLKIFMANYSGQDFGPCSFSDADTATYGYKEGEPCIFVKINKIINWQPYGFENLQEETDREDDRMDKKGSKAPSLASTLTAPYNKNLTYIRCYEIKKEEDKDQEKFFEVSYYPEHGGIDNAKFPYQGKKIDPKYIPPIVAVKLSKVKRGVEIKVGCKAYALNILDDERTNAGYMHFKLQIDE